MATYPLSQPQYVRCRQACGHHIDTITAGVNGRQLNDPRKALPPWRTGSWGLSVRQLREQTRVNPHRI